jgi:hypothetical protein
VRGFRLFVSRRAPRILRRAAGVRRIPRPSHRRARTRGPFRRSLSASDLETWGLEAVPPASIGFESRGGRAVPELRRGLARREELEAVPALRCLLGQGGIGDGWAADGHPRVGGVRWSLSPAGRSGLECGALVALDCRDDSMQSVAARLSPTAVVPSRLRSREPSSGAATMRERPSDRSRC